MNPPMAKDDKSEERPLTVAGSASSDLSCGGDKEIYLAFLLASSLTNFLRLASDLRFILTRQRHRLYAFCPSLLCGGVRRHSR